MRRGIRETVAEVQSGGVPALSESPPRRDRYAPVALTELNDDRICNCQQFDEHSTRILSGACGQNDAGLNQRWSADRDRVRCVDFCQEHLALGLVESDGDQRRRIENHTPSGL